MCMYVYIHIYIYTYDIKMPVTATNNNPREKTCSKSSLQSARSARGQFSPLCCRAMTRYVTSCRVVSCDAILCYAMLCCDITYDAVRRGSC